MDPVPAFTSYPLTHGELADLRADPFPTVVSAWDQRRLDLDRGGTHFGFVLDGPAILECDPGRFCLRDGMYFAVPGNGYLETGRGLVVTRLGHHGFLHLGGPIEERGRLRYIDGCTDSL